MAYTIDQLKAIEERNKNLLVSAAAGSGKTTVLVERVFRLIEEGANIDEFLIVTFTRAASADMKEKLYKRILERAQTGDRHFADQLERMDFASISTIHSFCMDVLHDHYELADIDPAFRVMDDAEEKQLLDDCLQTVLEEAYAERDEAMNQLIKLRETDEVRALVTALYKYLCTRPDPEAWFENAVSMMEGDLGEYKRIIAESARSMADEALDLIRRADEIAASEQGPLVYRDALEKDRQLAEGLCGLTYDELYEASVSGVTYERLKPIGKKDDVDPAKKEQCSELRKAAKDQIGKILSLVSLSPEQAAADLKEDVPVFRKLFDMAIKLMDALRGKKRDRGVLTFNDMERYTVDVLSDPEAAEQVRNKYKYIFVDEYQDTSDTQDTIVSRVARENNLFMVGDIKQSIYRFRNAEPALFSGKYEDYRSGRDENDLCIVLRENFRSRPAIIDFVNLIFERVMVGGDSDILYDGDARLNAGGTFEGEDKPVELLIVDMEKENAPTEKSEPGEDGDEGCEEYEDNGENESQEELERQEYEALAVARRIREIKEEEGRSYRDFCILSRNRGTLVTAAGILSAEGIPCYAEGMEAYFDTAEVLVLSAALKILVSRKNEVELLAVLRSPMFDVTSTELAQMKVDSPLDAPLWEAAVNAAEQNPKIARFMEMYDAWQVCRHGMSLCELIRKILSDTGFYTFAGALPGGEQRQANLDLFCQNALSYESRCGSSLSGFLDFMAGMQAKSSEGGAGVLSENDDVVRLMTCHKSKGLQFPVVFYVNAGRDFSKGGRSDSPLLTDRDLGLALPHIDNRRVSMRDTLAYKALKRSAHLKGIAEELRVLYVTFTRPQDRLIVVGSVNKADDAMEKWRKNAYRPGKYSGALDIVASAVLSCPGSEALGYGKRDGSLPAVITRIIPASSMELTAEQEQEDAQKKIVRLIASDAFDRELYDTINWTYPAAERPYAPVKMAVTGLKREYTGGDRLPEVMTAPDFISGRDRNEYSDRGSAIHMALRKLDYSPFAENRDHAFVCEETARQLNALRDRDILSAEEREYVKPSLIADFVLSDIGTRFMKAETKKREMSFSLRMPTSRAIPGYGGDGDIFVQGCIDMCFIEDGRWVLVDYKTNRTTDIDALVETYEYQLDIYAEALETLTGITVKEAYLCLLSAGKQIKVQTKRWEKA